MNGFAASIFLLGGLILTLAAFPVCGQENRDGIEINKQPLKDFAESAGQKDIDWTKSFLVEAETVLTKTGRFDKQKSKFTKSEGDAGMVGIVKQAFEAVGESGWFGYLTDQGVQSVKISAAQNSETFSISVSSALPTVERANTIASAVNHLVGTVLLMDKNDFKKLGEDEKKILSATKVTAGGKIVIINVSLPATDFQEMVKRRPSEPKEKKETAK
jgi:hypothetical protein